MTPPGPVHQPSSMRQLRRLVEAPLRRPWLVVLPLLLTLAAAIAASHLLPPRYRSSMLVLITPEQMPTSLVPQAASEKITRRLQTLRQEVQSRTRLETVARELDPYGTLGKAPMINTIERIREDVTVSVKGTDAFSIEYVHSNPQMAMHVVDRLTRLLLEDVAGTRQRQVSTAYQFIESELQDARQQLEQKEAALREYKERHMGQLPEQVPANLATLQRLQLEQQTLTESLRRSTDALLSLENAPAAPVVAAPTPAPDDPLTGMKASLAQLRTRYTEAHPDVKALAARVELLEAAKRAERTARAELPPTPPPVDLAAIKLAERRREAAIEMQALKARLGDVDRRIAAFQARVDSAPRREQEILVLTRDYQKLSENYARLLTKKLDAEMAARLEQQQEGRQFRILDPANLPQQPSFPDPTLFALAGAIAGLVLGAGLAVLVDWLDPTLKDADEAAAVLGLPLLAVIPYVPPKQQRRLATIRPAGAGHAANGAASYRRRHAPLTRTAAQHRGPEAL